MSACLACRLSKVKCERKYPCARCSRLGLHCVQPVAKARPQDKARMGPALRQLVMDKSQDGVQAGWSSEGKGAAVQVAGLRPPGPTLPPPPQTQEGRRNVPASSLPGSSPPLPPPQTQEAAASEAGHVDDFGPVLLSAVQQLSGNRTLQQRTVQQFALVARADDSCGRMRAALQAAETAGMPLKDVLDTAECDRPNVNMRDPVDFPPFVWDLWRGPKACVLRTMAAGEVNVFPNAAFAGLFDVPMALAGAGPIDPAAFKEVNDKLKTVTMELFLEKEHTRHVLHRLMTSLYSQLAPATPIGILDNKVRLAEAVSEEPVRLRTPYDPGIQRWFKIVARLVADEQSGCSWVATQLDEVVTGMEPPPSKAMQAFLAQTQGLTGTPPPSIPPTEAPRAPVGHGSDEPHGDELHSFQLGGDGFFPTGINLAAMLEADMAAVEEILRSAPPAADI